MSEAVWNFQGEMIKVRNVRIYGLEESVIASAYPMMVDTPNHLDFGCEILLSEKDLTRAANLGNVDQGTGHDCFLKGIIVQADFTFPQYLWQQAKRYHWFDFVSSTSTMHKITKMDIAKGCNPYVDKRCIAILQEYIDAYNIEKDPAEESELFHYVIANIPSGYTLTARITTNYLQLKTMYNQRGHHKMKDWKEFKMFCENLPYFVKFTQNLKKTPSQSPV